MLNHNYHISTAAAYASYLKKIFVPKHVQLTLCILYGDPKFYFTSDVPDPGADMVNPGGGITLPSLS